MIEKQSKLTDIVNNAISNFDTHEQYLTEIVNINQNFQHYG